MNGEDLTDDHPAVVLLRSMGFVPLVDHDGVLWFTARSEFERLLEQGMLEPIARDRGSA